MHGSFTRRNLKNKIQPAGVTVLLEYFFLFLCTECRRGRGQVTHLYEKVATSTLPRRRVRDLELCHWARALGQLGYFVNLKNRVNTGATTHGPAFTYSLTRVTTRRLLTCETPQSQHIKDPTVCKSSASEPVTGLINYLCLPSS
jgi:hypothetical protein